MASRMSKADRRDQLLAIAEGIVRDQGTDALTLITLAQQAGVSKPVTYEHFSTREGLLVELYQQYDKRFVSGLRGSLGEKTLSLHDTAHVVANAFIDCACNCGPVYERVIAALAAYPEYRDLKIRIRQFMVDAFLEIFAAHVHDQNMPARVVFAAMYGAMEELAQGVIHHEFDRQEAVACITRLLAFSVTPQPA